MVDSGKPKHTPGPWKIEVYYFENLAGYLINEGRNEPDRPTLEANARLIAAVPDMLEALEAIVDSAHDGREYPGWLHERLEQLAIPAIRKAVGDGR